MKMFLCLFMLIALFSSCDFSCKEQTDKLQENSIDKLVEKHNFKPIRVSDSIQPILDSLIESAIIDGEAVGYAGIKSDIYLCFERLVELATSEELIFLTDHKTPSVRAYAFWALSKKRNPIVKEIMMNHLNDTGTFSYMSGCSISEEQVNQFYLNLLTPQYIDLDCIKLTAEEVNLIRMKMNS